MVERRASLWLHISNSQQQTSYKKNNHLYLHNTTTHIHTLRKQQYTFFFHSWSRMRRQDMLYLHALLRLLFRVVELCHTWSEGMHNLPLKMECHLGFLLPTSACSRRRRWRHPHTHPQITCAPRSIITLWLWYSFSTWPRVLGLGSSYIVHRAASACPTKLNLQSHPCVQHNANLAHDLLSMVKVNQNQV